MSGLRTPTTLFLLLTLLPAAILAFLGWRGMAPLVDELTRAARGDMVRAFERTGDALARQMQAQDDALQGRLSAATEVARRQLPNEPAGTVLRHLERLVGHAVAVRTAGGGQLLPRGPAPMALDHLPEWPRFVAWRTGWDRGAAAAVPTFTAPSLQALALATAGGRDAEATAARLGELDGTALAAAGPLPAAVLAASASGRQMLRAGARAGWLDAVPATEAARLHWYELAGVDGERLHRQRLRALAEADAGAVLTARAEVVPGVELLALRDTAAALAALAPGAEGECTIALQPARAAAALQLDGDAAATGAVVTAWGPVAIAVTHQGLPRIQRQASRQRWLTGIGIAMLLLLMTTGMALVRRALLRERRARQLRDDFIANVSHELKTPLTGLRLYAEMLAADDLDAAARRRYGEIAQGEGARLSALVDDLLDFAALEQGRRRLEPEPIDLQAAAAAAAHSWQARATHDGVCLGCEMLGTAHALMDATALSRILTNLLQNAFRHGQPARDGGKRRIALRVGPGPCLTVTDNGPGIGAAEAERMFARFEKQRDSQGMGLGLSLSRELAEACGGTLRHRDTGAETCFQLQLPPVPDLPLGAEVTA